MLLLYLDSCIYVSISTGEAHIPLHYIRVLSSAIKHHKAQLVASKLVLQEVDQLSKSNNHPLIELLGTREYMTYQNITPSIRQGANDLVNQAEAYWRNKTSTKLKKKDSIHLYTAIAMGANEFHTNDKKILRLDRRILGNSKLIITTPDASPFCRTHRA